MRSISACCDGVLAVQRRGDLAVHMADRLQRAFAQVAALVAIAKLYGFMLAGGGAGRHSGPSHASVREVDIGFHGRIAARIQYLSSNDFYDCRHLLNYS